MEVTEIKSLSDPGVNVFACLSDAQLRSRMEPEKGIFIAESPKVINVALDAGYTPISILCEKKHIFGDASGVIARCGDIPIYTGERNLLASVTGYTLTRGVLCAMRRPSLPSVESVCKGASLIAVIYGVSDTTNIGAIFRSAAALGVDGILLSEDACDPLNRRAVRVSMGSVFLVPWTRMNGPVSALNDFGFSTVALALSPDALSIDDPKLASIDKKAVILGTEGDGLPVKLIADADFVARIPMSHNVDSLNVAAAAAVAFWQFRKNR